MEPVIKMLIFISFLSLTACAGYYLYRYFNRRITGSSNGWQLLLYICSMIVLNIILFCSSCLLLLTALNFLKAE